MDNFNPDPVARAPVLLLCAVVVVKMVQRSYLVHRKSGGDTAWPCCLSLNVLQRLYQKLSWYVHIHNPDVGLQLTEAGDQPFRKEQSALVVSYASLISCRGMLCTFRHLCESYRGIWVCTRQHITQNHDVDTHTVGTVGTIGLWSNYANQLRSKYTLFHWQVSSALSLLKQYDVRF
jgi:hypothetical protein